MLLAPGQFQKNANDVLPVPNVCYTDISPVPKEYYWRLASDKRMLTDVWPVTIITRVEAFFAFLGGKGAKYICDKGAAIYDISKVFA